MRVRITAAFYRPARSFIAFSTRSRSAGVSMLMCGRDDTTAVERPGEKTDVASRTNAAEKA